MVKETSIFKNFEKDTVSDEDLKSTLNTFTKSVYKKYGLKSYVCKLYASRWSFFAGDNEIYLSVKHFKISNEFGLIIEDNNTDEEIYNNIILSLKTLLK